MVLTNDSWLQVTKDGPWDVFARGGLGEEGVERVISRLSGGGVRGHLAIRLDPMLQAVELPAGIAHLDSSLADVD